MDHRLADLLLVSPPADTSWSGTPPEWSHPVIRRPDQQAITIGRPLFWYDPSWYRLPTDRANSLAIAVSQQDILVSALRSDVASANTASPFHETVPEGSDGQQRTQSLPRMVPYRPERYGLSDTDFDRARVIDVRLTMQRDHTGRFAYSAAQIERWEATPSGEPVSGGSWVPSATFPPDVESIQQLGVKLQQLRFLSSSAAVFVSVSPWHWEQEMADVLRGRPDGIIFRLDEIPSQGMELAVLTHRARKLMDREGATETPLWIVPGAISPDDAAKLIALGASAVAIDHWCEELWDIAAGQDRSTVARLGYAPALLSKPTYLSQVVQEHLHPLLDRFTGVLSSMQYLPPDRRLTCLDANWRDLLELQDVVLQ